MSRTVLAAIHLELKTGAVESCRSQRTGRRLGLEKALGGSGGCPLRFDYVEAVQLLGEVTLEI